MKPLDGKVGIVTGAGRPKGIGRATALRLADHGADVVVTDLCRKYEGVWKDYAVGDDFAALEALVKEIASRGVRGLAMAVDVTDRAQVEACVERTCRELGGIDVLFNNAGTAIGVGPFASMSELQWRMSLDVNVTGAFHFCQLAIPKMIERGGGSIINNASMAGLGAGEMMAGYNASKFAVVGLTKSIAAEFGPSGIRCNCVCPGMIHTDMGDAEYAFQGALLGISPQEAQERIAAGIALRRDAPAEEVADVVAYLAGPTSSYVTGVALPVAGGQRPGL
jgi:NAD(P)-dependent dehydrogenase (short-subunit alcohol dehydrogenase family)